MWVLWVFGGELVGEKDQTHPLRSNCRGAGGFLRFGWVLLGRFIGVGRRADGLEGEFHFVAFQGGVTAFVCIGDSSDEVGELVWVLGFGRPRFPEAKADEIESEIDEDHPNGTDFRFGFGQFQ